MKILVVGGSLAGLSFATELIKLVPDAKINLVEKKKTFGEPTICARGVSTFAMKRTRVSIPRSFLDVSLKFAELHSPNSLFRIGRKGVYGYIIWREGYEKWLARNLEGKVKFELGEKFRGAKTNRYDVVIGADGIMGGVRGILDLPPPRPKDLHIASQRLVRCPELRQDTVYLYFGSIAPKGYAWFFPTGLRNIFRAGLGVPISEKQNVAILLRKFIKKMGAESLLSTDSKLVPTTKPPQKYVYGNTLLVGDAAPVTDPLTGGGIVNAIASGKLAARAVAEGRLKNYERYAKKEFYLQNLMRYRLKEIICDFSDEEFDLLFDTLKGSQLAGDIMLALTQAFMIIALKKPKFFVSKQTLRRLFSPRM